jgi:dTMP kinase
MAAGRLIVLEGAEGAGKTTQLRLLAERLSARGETVIGVREPGGTVLGDEIRTILLHSAHDIVPRAEALLFMASRAQLVEREIRPALARGDVVLLDRFFLSTYAYQIAGHGLAEAEVRAANAFATAGLVPDLTLLLTFPVAEGLARAGGRTESHDRMEAMGLDFHGRVGAAFTRFQEQAWQDAHPECGPIVTVLAEGTEAAVAARVHAVVQSVWPGTFAG